MNINKTKKIMKRKLDFISSPIYKYISNNNNRICTQYSYYYEHLSIQNNTILFESRDGNSFTDNPYAIYKYMIQHNDKFPDFKYYWVYNETADLELLQRNFNESELQNAKFVKRNTNEYVKLLASCKYLVNNSTFQSFFIKKKEQIYINTWHGTPLKTMGFDIPNNPYASQNVLRNFLMTDYIISPNTHTSNIFINSYKLKGLYEGKILENGYPRIDLTINAKQEDILQKLENVGINIDKNKKTIMYTPTWKGTNLSNPDIDIYQILTELSLVKKLCGDKYNVLLKVHPYVYNKIKNEKKSQDFLVPDYYDANEIMSIVDILITDYSSIFFDFLVTDKPIIFYSWDNDLYTEERGMYFKKNELPGPVVSTIFEVIDYLKNPDTLLKYKDFQYKIMKESMVKYDNGEVTKSYLECIFGNKSIPVTITPYEDKEHIIIYPGGLLNNGITTSFLNLLDNIDYNKYDVTVFCSTRKNDEILTNIRKINSNARLMFRIGVGDYSLEERYLDRLIQNRSLTDNLEMFYPEKAYRRESKRLSGGCHFESSIDFSGYSYYWAKYILNMDADKKIVFQHNDLYSDSQKVVDGKHPHLINLRGIFSLYSKFDEILSVSPLTRDVNYNNLSSYAEEEKFQYCVNTINIKKIFGDLEVNLLGNNEYHIEKTFNHMKVKKDGDYTIIPDLYKEDLFYTLNIQESQQLTMLATSKVDGIEMAKVLVDNIYCGWIKKGFLVDSYDPVLQESIINSYAKIVKVSKQSIYSEPYKISQNTYRCAALGYLKNAIVYVTERVVTTSGKYIKIQIDGKFIGWIEENSVCYVSNVSESFVKKHNEKYLNKINDRTLYSQESIGIGTIIKDMPNIYSHEYGNRNSKLLPYICKVNMNNCKVYVEWKITNSEGTSYKIHIPNGIVGWIREQDLEFVPLSQADIVLYEEETKCIDFKLKNISFPLYQCLNDMYLGLNPCYIDSEQNHFISYKKIWTKFGTVLYVQNQSTKEWFYGLDMNFDFLNAFTDMEGRILKVDHNKLNFVSMGRLSPEKNQKSLILAVHKVLEFLPELRDNMCLYIIGFGPLYNELKAYISQLGLEDVVFLLGQKEDPFSILKQCDCFVLSSVYEGQPMVLLEALTLGMDIIATNIPANSYVLKDGKYGLMTKGTTAEDIFDTLIEYIENKDSLHFDEFNYQEYNSNAIQNFYSHL